MLISQYVIFVATQKNDEEDMSTSAIQENDEEKMGTLPIQEDTEEDMSTSSSDSEDSLSDMSIDEIDGKEVEKEGSPEDVKDTENLYVFITPI